MQILIRNLNNGKTITVEAEEGHDLSIESIKAKIEAKEGIPAKRQRLFIPEKKLDRGKGRNSDYSMNNENKKMHLFLGIREPMQIIVRNHTGKSRVIEAEGHEFIDSIKVNIQEKEGIPAHLQRLVFAGRDLKDGTTLADNKISHHSTLQLLPRLGGGPPDKNVSTLHLLLRLRRHDFSTAFV